MGSPLADFPCDTRYIDGPADFDWKGRTLGELTTEELTALRVAHWPGGEAEAVEHLKRFRFELQPDRRWLKPYSGYKILGTRDGNAIDYLQHFHDYGGVVAEPEDARPLVVDCFLCEKPQEAKASPWCIIGGMGQFRRAHQSCFQEVSGQLREIEQEGGPGAVLEMVEARERARGIDPPPREVDR